MKRKTGELQHLLEKNDGYNIVVVTETHHKAKPQIRGYNTVHKARANGQGGGVAIFIKYGIDYTELETHTNSMETAAIKTNNTVIVAVYNRPHTYTLVHEIEDLLALGQKVILTGDFNAKSRSWGCRRDDLYGRHLATILDYMDADVVAPEEYTYIPAARNQEPSTLDLAIVKNVLVAEIKALTELSSDHLPVHIELKSVLRIEGQARTILNYRDADWAKFRTIINQRTQVRREFGSTEEIDTQVDNLSKIIKDAAEEAIPERHFTRRGYPQEVDELIRERNRIRRRWQRRGHDPDDAEELRELNSLVRTSIWSHYEAEWHSRIRKAEEDRGNVWKFLRTRKLRREGQRERIPTLSLQNTEYTTAHEKAELFADRFEGYTRLTMNMSDEGTVQAVRASCEAIRATETALELGNYPTPREIAKIIKKMPPHKAPGVDGIQNVLLKRIPRKMLVALHYVYKECLKRSHYPAQWKIAATVPAKKKKKKADAPDSYRPISLLCAPAKILDVLILRRLNRHTDERRTMIEEQFGFAKRKTAELQLSRIVSRAQENSNTGKATAMVCIDLEKAYDTVWQEGLLHKLKEEDIPMYIIKILDEYISNRRMIVRVEGKTSGERILREGLPQGSALSPALFNLYINDIPRTATTKIALYADDIAVVAESTREDQAQRYVQRHLSLIEEYLQRWKLKANAEKTENIIFCHKRVVPPTPPLRFINEDITRSDRIKYLGVQLDRKLLFREHLKNLRAKGRAVLGHIGPYIAHHCPLQEKTKVLIYKAYTRSVLTYAATVWSSAARTYIKNVQIIETKALRKIRGLRQSDISNADLYNSFNMMPLTEVVKERTRRMVEVTSQEHEITQDIGRWTRATAPFRVKHKLFTHILEE